MSEQINIDQLNDEQLAKLQEQLAAKQAKARKEKEKAKVQYERQRDRSIKQITSRARSLSELLKEFKAVISAEMEAQHVALTEYGEIRSNSKGGFSITSSCGTMRVTRTRETEPFWDERGTKAVAMLKEFLEETAKKRDQDLFKILMSFLARNEKGDLEYAKVFSLLQHRNAFDDPRWIEGLNLLEESFQIYLRAYGYEVKVKNPEGKWDQIGLNFTAL
jgi:hypothetical protein